MLVICPTPIGNLEDITERQRQALAAADIIACEDTRRTGKLLELLGIARVDGRPRLWRYDDHTASEEAANLVDRMVADERVVLVSDAGTPTISDPGFKLVRLCRERGIEVQALPGPVAAMVALSGSGLPTNRFYFEGFLPTGTEKRQARLIQLDQLDVTTVAYESPRRIVDALRDVQAVMGERREVCVARELTKMHEEFLVGPVSQVVHTLEERGSIRGEVVLCVGPGVKDELEEEQIWQDVDRTIEILHGQQVRSRTIKEIIDELYEVPRSKIYDRIDQVVKADER